MKKMKVILCMLVLLIVCVGCSSSGEKLLVMGTIKDEDYPYDVSKGEMEAKLLFYPKDQKIKSVSIVVNNGEEDVFVNEVEAINEENVIYIKTYNTEEGFVFEGGFNDSLKQEVINTTRQSIFPKSLYASQVRESPFNLLQFLEKHENVPSQIDVIEFEDSSADRIYTVSIQVK